MLKASSVLGNSQRLDGGAMFGNAPRALWSRWAAPDEAGRVALACRALLVEDGSRRILFETGIGSFFAPELRERYGVVEAEHVLLESLAELGLNDGDIDVVVLSHLHFDHAGGLLAPFRAGAKPELLFRRAQFVVGRTAFERAVHPHLRDRASYIPELPELLRESRRLHLIEPDGDVSSLLGSRVRFAETLGHTPGMIHARVQGERARLFFAADLVPGRAWVHLPITMGYDRFPEQLVDEKAALFRDFVAHDEFLFFTHDPQIAAARVQEQAGRFKPSHELSDFAAWDLDAQRLPGV
ncbi:MAG TPA: MBL fold metallo-hydrolase [Polyangiaceae bacterium]|jgi:glyoxylase-like metal-dependent hydrolase (beta-lactamase superfamily II)|nr:MBL fold metallo-hydrolase [Polyangiaceae bacterium]